MPHHEVVALWVIERGKAPGVFEGYEVRFLWMVVEMNGPEASNLLSCHLRAVDALLQRRGKDCYALAGVATCLRRGYSRVVQIRKNPRYLLCSNSAMMQSTMCGLGVRM
jgi:hypothetical protein